jgi:hypothetical protein
MRILRDAIRERRSESEANERNPTSRAPIIGGAPIDPQGAPHIR